MLQNVCSLVAARVLAPMPGARVLDTCAAPGGKTTAIAQLMANQGEVRAGLQGQEGVLVVEELQGCRVEGRRVGMRGADMWSAAQALAGRMQAGLAVQQTSEPPRRTTAPQVVAFDRSHAKAAGVRQLAEGFGLSIVRAYKMDATKAVLPAQQAQQQQQAAEPAAAAQGGDAAAADAADAPSRGRRGGLTMPPSAATLRKLERVAQAKRARGIEPAPSAHVPGGKEAVVRGFPPASFDFVLCDAPCTALGLRPR